MKCTRAPVGLPGFDGHLTKGNYSPMEVSDGKEERSPSLS